MLKKYLNPEKFSTLFLYISILIFIIAFGFQDNPSGGWYQQFLPNLNNRPLVDITFTDSLTGYALITQNNFDTSFVIKTTNGGDNWSVILAENQVEYRRIVFLNNNTGYIGGATLNGGVFTYLLKTVNGGLNWTRLNTPDSDRLNDIAVLNEDTIWYADASGFNGGIFRTTNGGVNWTYQGQQNNLIKRIYMYNRNLGFASSDSYLFRTTNSGLNWDQVPGQNGFRDIYFADGLTGWKANVTMKKSTDGGLSWTTQTLQSGGYIQSSGISQFSIINSDTIWGTGGYVVFPNNQIRAILHRTTNGGTNWTYQIPDTSIRVFPFYINFVNKNIGWAYDVAPTGIHTKVGGDTIFLNIKQISDISSENFALFQNFPNPFNPRTKISYEVKQKSEVLIGVYDILGNELETLVKSNVSAGKYNVEFDGSDYSTGIYFYRMEAKTGKENFSATGKMMLIK